MTKKHRIIISLLSIWSFIQIIFLFLSPSEETVFNETQYWINKTDEFCPFESYDAMNWLTRDSLSRLLYYDITEFLVYAISPWLIFILYRFVQKGK